MSRQLILFSLIIFIVSGCGSYSSQEATKDGYVVSGPEGQVNVEKLEQFYERFLNHEEGKVRIVHYTDEGDPVYLDLISDGQSIRFSRDNSDDKYGGQDKGKKSTSCKHFIKSTGPRAEEYGTEYVLQDCSDDIGYSHIEKKEYFILFIEEKK